MVDRRVPAPASAPNPRVSPKFGEDALSFVLGSPAEDSYDSEFRARIASVLDRQPNRSIRMFELSKKANLDFVVLSRLLDQMQDSGEVTVEGDPGEERVRALG